MFIALVACDNYPQSTSTSSTNPADSIFRHMYGNERKFDDYQVIMIDGCEYIAYKSNNTQFLSIEHKGNCKNPIHYQVKHDTIFLWKEGKMILQRKSYDNKGKGN